MCQADGAQPTSFRYLCSWSNVSMKHAAMSGAVLMLVSSALLTLVWGAHWFAPRLCADPRHLLGAISLRQVRSDTLLRDPIATLRASAGQQQRDGAAGRGGEPAAGAGSGAGARQGSADAAGTLDCPGQAPSCTCLEARLLCVSHQSFLPAPLGRQRQWRVT